MESLEFVYWNFVGKAASSRNVTPEVMNEKAQVWKRK